MRAMAARQWASGVVVPPCLPGVKPHAGASFSRVARSIPAVDLRRPDAGSEPRQAARAGVTP